ncbi:MAG: hypothetical protein JNK64_34825 [Myxococcales bacterium]|nr:hypothetical protein [Myxococcales bacterium]
MGGRRVLTALAVAGLAACGDDAPAARDHFTSGTRLRAQWWEFAGGTTLFRGFVDTARGEPCWFDELVGPSGVDRCLPSGALTFFRRSATSFADPACTEPVVSASGAEPAVLAVPDDACASEPALFELGPVAATHYRRDAGGACVVETAGLFHTLGPAIPLDRFAAATPTVEPAGGRIDGYALVADDGARQVIGGWDRDRGERVVDSPELPDGRWSPRGIAYADVGVFADAGCTRAVARKYGDSAVCPVTTILGAGGHWAAGARIDPRALFRRDGAGACVAFSDDRGDLFFEIGAPIAADAFAPLRTVAAGAGRVRRQDAAGPDGAPILPRWEAPLLDTATAQPCAVRVASDGVARCLPQRYDGGYFADAACTQPVLQASAPPALVAIEDRAAAMFVVRPVGAPYAAATVYVQQPTGCTGVPRVDGFDYFLLGAARAPADFAAAIAHD